MPRKRRDAPWLDRRSNGVYYAYWYDAEKRRTRSCSLDTTDPGEARIAFAQFLINGRTIYESGDDGLTVTAGVDQYLREHAAVNCADPTRQEDAGRHLKAFFKDTLLSDIDIPMSRRYVDARRAGEIGGGRRRKNKAGSDSTIRRELNVLVAAANHAVRWKRLAADKVPSVELPAETSMETPWFTRDEMLRLFEVSDGLLHRFVRVAYFTGGRKTSIQGLRREQIDFRSKVINLKPFGSKNTVKRKPIVPLYDEIRPDIEWLIGRAEGEELFGRWDAYRPFRQLCEAHGMGGKAHPHVLRHSRATHLLQRGVSIYSVAKLLGDTVTTIERTYGHQSSEYLAETTGEM